MPVVLLCLVQRSCSPKLTSSQVAKQGLEALFPGA